MTSISKIDAWLERLHPAYLWLLAVGVVIGLLVYGALIRSFLERFAE